MSKSLIAIICIVATVALVAHNLSYASDEFDSFVAVHKRNYNSVEEYEFRRNIFMNNLDYIEEFNSQGHTWWLGVNQFTDMTDEEFRQFLGYKPQKTGLKPLDTIKAPENVINDEAIDWREKGYVRPVKNQGTCGSCWAFATNFGVEAAWVKYNQEKLGKTVSPPDLSEQMLMDCDMKNGSCLGGLMQWAYAFYQENCPVFEKDYPYEEQDADCRNEGHQCATDKVLDWYDIKKYDDNSLRHALSLAPVVIGIQAENMEFRSYAGGIISEATCGYRPDHAVGIVGEYFNTTIVDGQEVTIPVWKVRNSWGASWGDEGYVNVERKEILVSGLNVGVCGINMDPSIPTFMEYYH